MSKFHRLFEATQGGRSYFNAATSEPLQEASIAKMNRKAKAGSKSAPSTNQKPYNSLSAQEKKVVDRQVAADAKGFMNGYGMVKRDADGPMLWIVGDPIAEYDYRSFESFADGNFQLTLRPKLVGFNKVTYSYEGGDYEPSTEFDDGVELETIVIEAEDALERGGLEELQRLIKDNIPSTREVSKALEDYKERINPDPNNDKYWDRSGRPL